MLRTDLIALNPDPVARQNKAAPERLADGAANRKITFV